MELLHESWVEMVMYIMNRNLVSQEIPRYDPRHMGTVDTNYYARQVF